MPIGPAVRRLLGRWERPVSLAYRRLFVDLDGLSDRLRGLGDPRRILEVGCGEGLLTASLAATFPGARLTGIDISDRVGRLFTGERERVEFRREDLAPFAARHEGGFDLVVLCDVLHHVPARERLELLRHTAVALAPAGRLIVKDWERRRNPIHLLGYLSDRVLTGDRISYMTGEELAALVEEALGPGSVEATARLPPWVNNLVVIARPRASRATFEATP